MYIDDFDKIILFSPIRTGSTLIYNLLRELFPNKSVQKTHFIKEFSYHHNAICISTIRQPYNSIISSLIREKETNEISITDIEKEIVTYITFGGEDILKIENVPNILLYYEDFFSDINLFFEKIQKYTKHEITSDVRLTLKTKYSISSVEDISSRFSKFSELDETTQIHGKHISKYKGMTDYYDLLSEEHISIFEKNSIIQNIIQKYYTNIPTDISNFPLNNVYGQQRYLAFDIFLKKGLVYLICPLYDDEIDTSDLTIRQGNHSLTLIENKIFDKETFPSIQILIFQGNGDYMTIKVDYKTFSNSYSLKNVKNKKNNLSLTTLFVHASYLFPMVFYDFYKKHGVEHFYLYYNGDIPDNLLKNPIFTGKDVTLIPWKYHYWNNDRCKYKHHAQIGQLHHALYKYGKTDSKYMIFNDFDEYFRSPLLF